jgi:hypothetical protein
MAGAGTNEGATSACRANRASPSASLTSLWRPGTCWTSRALTSPTVNRSSSRQNTGFQESPVASSTTDPTRDSAGQSAEAISRRVIVANVRICCR